MRLPPIAYYSIYEIAARWGCHPADVAGWAAAGHLQVIAGIPAVLCAGRVTSGFVEVQIAELMSMFRRYGPSDECARLTHVLPLGTTEWLHVTDPPEGLLVRSNDLLLAAGPVQQFEEERDLLRRPPAHGGASPRYDWDAMYAWLFWESYETGLPQTKAALVGLVQQWFIDHSPSGEAPDESTIRKRIAPLWGKLRSGATA